MLYHSITTRGTKYYVINFWANHPPKCRPSVENSRDSFPSQIHHLLEDILFSQYVPTGASLYPYSYCRFIQICFKAVFLISTFNRESMKSKQRSWRRCHKYVQLHVSNVIRCTMEKLKNGSVDESHHFSHRVPRFASQQPHGN